MDYFYTKYTQTFFLGNENLKHWFVLFFGHMCQMVSFCVDIMYLQCEIAKAYRNSESL